MKRGKNEPPGHNVLASAIETFSVEVSELREQSDNLKEKFDELQDNFNELKERVGDENHEFQVFKYHSKINSDLVTNMLKKIVEDIYESGDTDFEKICNTSIKKSNEIDFTEIVIICGLLYFCGITLWCYILLFNM
ncbi:hypothetical protein [Microcystis phage Mel-JY01]